MVTSNESMTGISSSEGRSERLLGGMCLCSFSLCSEDSEGFEDGKKSEEIDVMCPLVCTPCTLYLSVGTVSPHPIVQSSNYEMGEMWLLKMDTKVKVVSGCPPAKLFPEVG